MRTIFFDLDHVGVSIPLWFDWKEYAKSCKYRPTQFQFHFGSIGRGLYNSNLVARIKFQFHFGSIGSVYSDLLRIMPSLFQFHFGSIGRSTNLSRYIDLQGFNSTLVRLEVLAQDIAKMLIKFQFHFGSIGRIKELQPFENLLTMFQFHFGSIGR